MSKRENSEILIILHNIEDKLQELLEIQRMVNKENIEAAQDRVLSGSSLRKQIFNLCNGNLSVSEIAKTTGKSLQQISNNIAILQNVGLIREVKQGKQKFYEKTR
jgi:Fic family protein